MSLIQINSNKISPKNSNSLINLTVTNNPDIKIWLVDPTYTQQQISSESIPAAIGGIATFTEHYLKLRNPIRLFKYPEVFAKALNSEIPDIVGFSNYMWNSELSLALARRVKEISPRTIIVMGGPNYPVTKSEQEIFLRKHPEIDFYVIGEGELAFANLVATLINEGLDKNKIRTELPSVHFITNDNQICITDNVERIKDLTEIPSPYIMGKLDEFFDGKLQPVIQTTRGCPFGCTFCVEGTNYYSKIYRNSLEKTVSELEYIGNKMLDIKKKGGRNDLWLVDSNFGMYTQDLDTCKAIANCQEKYGWPEYIQCDTGKNNKTRVLDAAKLVNGAIRLSGSVQTLDQDVLKNIKRSNISGDDLMQLAVQASEIDADSRSEIILGLPGESLKSHFTTIQTVINAGFNKVDNYQLMMLPGTEVNTPEIREKFGMQTKYRILPRCFGYYEILNKMVISAEIEEICVTTNTLSFEDYIKCRKMHLIIHLYHNDVIFSTILKFIRSLNMSVFRWIELIHAEELTGEIKQLFDKFEQETRNELWSDKTQLEKNIQQKGVVDSYIKGDLGYNLLFVHKAIAIRHHMQGLKELARITIKQLLAENNHDTLENMAFVDDALEFDVCRSTNIFENLESMPEQIVNYDIVKFNSDKIPNRVEYYKLHKQMKLSFVLSNEQKDVLNRSISLYGNDELGVSRILTKVFVKKLVRNPIPESKISVIVSR